MDIVQQFYHLQLDLTPLNKAHMILIPKGTSTSNMEDYRPMSVINLIPKLISKVLANRLKHHLPVLISAQQTAFIGGRFIAENFNTAREMLRHVEQQMEPAILVKLVGFWNVHVTPQK
jgi:Reverse transcriptase (RNA-dependent DNA polymerase)